MGRIFGDVSSTGNGSGSPSPVRETVEEKDTDLAWTLRILENWQDSVSNFRAYPAISWTLSFLYHSMNIHLSMWTCDIRSDLEGRGKHGQPGSRRSQRGSSGQG